MSSDGAEHNVPNHNLGGVEVDDGLIQINPSPIAETVRLGKEAMARKRRGWDDYMAIAEALQVGRTEAMRAAHTNQPRGRRYEKAISQWLIDHSFQEIDKGTRKRLLDCLEHRREIEAWRAQLTDAQRSRFSHPLTVLRKWKAATAPADATAPMKVSSVQKLKDENERMRAEIRRGGGDLWTPADRPQDIACVMVGQLGRAKAEKVAREILGALKEMDKS